MVDEGVGTPPAAPGPGAGGPVGEVRPLHASEAKALLACPTMWGHAYRSRRVPRVDAHALTRGRAVHEWLSHWWMGRKPPASTSFMDPVVVACCVSYSAYYGAPPVNVLSVEDGWRAEIGGVECAGTTDATMMVERQLVVVEHKTTSQDIAPGSLYWRQVVTTDPQVSMYRAAFPGAKILYDAIRKPTLRQKQGETDDAFVARCVQQMAERPEAFFARAYVVRLESEDEAFARDVQAIDAMRRLPMLPRNPGNCFAYGTRCSYFGVCWEGESLADESKFRDQDENR